MKTRKSFKDFMEEAQRTVDGIDIARAMEMAGDPKIQFVDVRDYQELVAMGRIPGAAHASRGMLEFLIDPESPYYKEMFTDDKEYVVYCMSGGRSALAARRMQEMGFEKVHTLTGGLKAWLEAGGETEPVEE